MRNREDTQCAFIVSRLRQVPGEWVSMPELVAVSGSFNIHTRIDEIRHRLGHAVECKIERRQGSRRQFSFYRIPDQREAQQSPATPAAETQTQTTTTTTTTRNEN
jgi:hypothetical protein